MPDASAPAAEADANTLAALEEGELATAALLTPASPGSHAAQVYDAPAAMRHAKMADIEAVVQRMLQSRDQQLEQKLRETIQRLADVKKSSVTGGRPTAGATA